MFTSGRILFTIVFIILFAIGMIYAYRKDMKQLRKWFGGIWQIVLSLIVIFFLYYIFARLV